jgi:hypothetical protein
VKDALPNAVPAAAMKVASAATIGNFNEQGPIRVQPPNLLNIIQEENFSF